MISSVPPPNRRAAPLGAPRTVRRAVAAQRGLAVVAACVRQPGARSDGRPRCRGRATAALPLPLLLALLSLSLLLPSAVAQQGGCDFDSTTFSSCSYTESGMNRWVRDYRTPSYGTGPTSAYSGTRFAFLETSYGYRGEISYLNTPTLPAYTRSMNFAYHMYGANMGTLSVEVLNAGKWTAVFTKTGQQTPTQTTAWTFTQIGIAPGAVQARFKGVKGSSYKGDMAVDSIAFSSTVINSCVCANGEAANGPQCPVDGAALCIRCTPGYDKRVDANETHPEATRSYCEVAKTVRPAPPPWSLCSGGDLSAAATLGQQLLWPHLLWPHLLWPHLLWPHLLRPHLLRRLRSATSTTRECRCAGTQVGDTPGLPWAGFPSRNTLCPPQLPLA
jgi:hypothetical protein